jgi:Spy/CpxP family protein refolding chaperone
MQRPQEIALALLTAALIAGGALGYAGGRYAAAKETMPGERGAMRHYIASQLDLDAAQIAKMDTILDARRDEMTKIIAPVKPQLDASRTAAREKIMAILTPAQQKRFQEILAAKDKAEEAGKK